MARRKFKLVRNPSTSQLQWAPTSSGGLFSALVGWCILVVSTVLFLLVSAYFAYVIFLARPTFDPSTVHDDSAYMREGIHILDKRP